MNDVRPIRIAVLFEFPTLNGGERSMLAVLDCLQRDNRFEFTAVAPERGPLADALRARGIHVKPLCLRDEFGRRPPREKLLEDLQQTLQTINPNLVHANSLAMGRLTGELADSLGVPCVAHLRDIMRLSRSAVAALNRNTRLIAVSEATRTFHMQQGLDAGKTAVIYNGVDCEQFRRRERSPTGWNPTGRSPWALKGRRPWALTGAFVVLTVGQIGLRKGQDVLAEAAVRLESRGTQPAGFDRAQPAGFDEIHYVVVGERHSNKAESIEFEREFVRRFERAGIAHRLHRLGYRNDVPRLMNQADLLVHPAQQEPLGRVLLEAAAAELPIVATDVGGTREILTDGLSARLIPPGDPHSLATAIEEMAGSPGLRTRFATNARRGIEERFQIEHAASALRRLWERILENQRR